MQSVNREVGDERLGQAQTFVWIQQAGPATVDFVMPGDSYTLHQDGLRFQTLPRRSGGSCASDVTAVPASEETLSLISLASPSPTLFDAEPFMGSSSRFPLGSHLLGSCWWNLGKGGGRQEDREGGLVDATPF